MAFQPRSTALELLAEMLAMNPDRRISARQALEHPYFKQAGPCYEGFWQCPRITRQTPVWIPFGLAEGCPLILCYSEHLQLSYR